MALYFFIYERENARDAAPLIPYLAPARDSAGRLGRSVLGNLEAGDGENWLVYVPSVVGWIGALLV